MTARDDREREKSIRETIGKFFFDLAKTTFTAMVIGGSVALITGMEEALPYAILLGVWCYFDSFISCYWVLYFKT